MGLEDIVKKAICWGTFAAATAYLGYLTYQKQIVYEKTGLSWNEVMITFTALTFGMPLAALKAAQIVRDWTRYNPDVLGNQKEEFLDPAIKNINKATLVTYLTTIASLNYLDDKVMGFNGDIDDLRSLYPQFALAVPLAARYVLLWGKNTVPPYLRNIAKQHWYSLKYLFKGMNDGDLEKLAETCKPSLKQVLQASNKIKKGDVEEGLIQYKESLETLLYEEKYPMIEDRIAEAISIKNPLFMSTLKMLTKSTIDQSKTEEQLGLAHIEFYGLNFDKGLERLDRLGERNIGLRVISALAGENIVDNYLKIQKVAPKRKLKRLKKSLSKRYGDKHIDELLHDHAHGQWEHIIREISANPELADSFDSIEGHSVYRVDFSKIIPEYAKLFKDKMVFKQNPKEKLESEKIKLLEIEKGISPQYGVVDPFRIIEVDGLSYLIERHAKGKRLTEAYAETGDVKLFEESARCLQRIHSRMPVEGYASFNPEQYLSKKLENAQISDDLKRDMWDYLRILFKWVPQDKVWDKDPHSDNWYVSDEGKIIVLDAEDRGVKPRVFNLSKHVYSNALSEAEANGVVYAYCQDAAEVSGVDLEFGQMFEDVRHATPIGAASYWLFALENASKMGRAEIFLQNSHIVEKSSKLFSREKKKIRSLVDKLLSYRAIA